MAITIQNTPSNDVSVSDEILWVAYEATKANDDVTYPDYRYVADIYVDTVFAARLKARPDPTYRMGKFDVATILRSYAVYGLKANIASYAEDITATVDYSLAFGEEYGFTTFPALVNVTGLTAFKSYKPRPFVNSEVVVNDAIASNIPNGTGKKVFTYKSVKWFLLNVYNDTYAGGVHNHVVTFYDVSDNVIATVSKASEPAVDGMFLQMNIGPAGFVSRAEITQATLDNTARIRVTWGVAAINIYITCEGKYTPMTLAWLNPYGVYDSYSFGLVSKKTNELTRKDFGQLNYRMNASGQVSYHEDGVFYGGRKGYAATVKTSLKLTSHLLTEDEYVWLADLFASPDVYLYDSVSDKFFPVSITDTNYEHRKYNNSKLPPLEFTIGFSDDYNAQFL